VLAALSVAGALTLAELIGVAVVYGAATAFFDPASDALVPQLLPVDLLAQANSLDQLIRPVALRLAGPAVGGLVVGLLGSGGAFGIDAMTFAVSAGTLLAMSPRRVVAEDVGSVRREIGAGLRYVRSHAWLWATLVSAAVAYLLFMGPTEVLLPFIVKNRLHAGAGDLGLIFGAGGLGSLACALVIGQRGLPRHTITFIYAVWTLATLAVAGYGIATGLWGLMLASVAFNTLETAGTIAWATAKQRHVPAALLGRVSSLDWLISIGLLPVSYALTGPVSAAIGPRATLIGAGVLGAVVTFAPVLIPEVRALDASAQLLDADQVAGGVTEGAIADPVGLVGRLLDDVGVAGLEPLEDSVEVGGGQVDAGVGALGHHLGDRAALVLGDAGGGLRRVQND
jgi:DHA3 family tetracycline resistance protein-like MFS transporter